MMNSVRLTAEEKFAAIQKKDKLALMKKEIAQQERADKMARLKALRLAKEAVDKKVAG
jgi:hypothetical protein